MTAKSALIAMSGGVDSSVSALLMTQQGYQCVGCTMKLFANDQDIGGEKTCCSLSDVEDARSVAHKLGMKYYVFNFQDEFKQKVIDPFVCAYQCGKTPNPCLECNRHLKFAKLFERAQDLGLDYVVTGHYARVVKQGDKFVLKKAVDPTKDQSYVLYTLTQTQLAHTIFPLGELTKTKVREIARANGFVNADKADSQDICFVPDGDYARVIENVTGEKAVPGNFVDRDGKVLGRHKGIVHYTIGQRRGLGIAHATPLYVVKICPENNTVVLGDEADLYQKEMLLGDFNWIAGEVPTEPVRCQVKIRYKHAEQPATLYPQPDQKVRVVFDQPQRAITAGQAGVAYQGEIVIGGGTILGTL